MSSRDLLHAAVMDRLGTRVILSAEHGFDRLPHLRRLHPADVAAMQRHLAH